jgi:hypothetical protein
MTVCDCAVSTIAVACALATVSGCAGSRAAVAHDEFPPRIVASSPCADARPTIEVRSPRVAKDLGHKPSRDVRRYLVDLHILRSDQMDLWLLMDEHTFPSVVDSVWRDENFLGAEVQSSAHTRPWWFSGNDTIRAWPLGRASDTSIRSIDIGTGALRIAVTLGVIELDGASPQEWLMQNGDQQPWNTRGQPRARGVFVPFCTTWIDLSAVAQDPNSAAGFLLRDGTRARLPSQG